MEQQEQIIVPNFKQRKKEMFMTPKEFSEEYQIGINKTYQLINRKGAPVLKNGNRYLIIRSQIEQWFIDNIGLEF